MMQQVAPGKHQMAHYAFATGIMNLGVMLPGMMSGYLSDGRGYRDFFVWVLYGKKALIVTGRTSAKKSGLYDRVVAKLDAAHIGHVNQIF